MIAFLLLVPAFLQLAVGRTIYYDWDIEWVTAAPDGFARPVIGINGQWPCPTVEATIGDRVIFNVHNGLGNQSTGLHWHGLGQRGTPHMDGSVGVTQCPIPPGGNMTYDFVLQQSGTYWYHSHNLGQYPDGLWGPFLISDPDYPYKDQIDGEFTMTLTDWYHEQMPVLMDQYESRKNENDNSGDEPTPDSALMGASQNFSIKVEPNKTYLIHIICVGNFPGHAFLFDQHNMTVVEVDGVVTDKYPVGDNNVRIATGQRMSVLITTKNDTSTNYAIWDTLDINMLFFNEGKNPPPTFNGNVTGYLIYNESAPLPPQPIIHGFNFVDDVNFVPHDHMPVLEPVHHRIILDMDSADLNGIPRFVINSKTYLQEKVPSLYTALTVGKDSTNPKVYGHVNPLVLEYGDVVEIVVNDHHQSLHPWHLHGHQFQVLERTAPEAGYFNGTYGKYSRTPIRRDTIMVQQHGYMVMRFRADNPDMSPLPCVYIITDYLVRVWLFHCHIEWHVGSGLSATMIEAPYHLKDISIPRNHLEVCKMGNMPIAGNAAGNVRQPLNLTGDINTVPLTNYGSMWPPGTVPSERTGYTS